ncbi:hypothetical protein MTO96_017616 [Rhipicephalus appendiculatus]
MILISKTINKLIYHLNSETSMYGTQESDIDMALISADPSSTSAESKASAGDGPRLAAVVICTMIFLGFIVVGMAVAVIALSSDTDARDVITKAEEPPAKTERDPGNARGLTAIVPEFRTQPKNDVWFGLLCTIGTKLTDPKMLPDDKVCSYLFYDSVYKKGPTPFDPNNVDPALSIFLDGGKKLPRTRLGIAFAYKYRQHLKSELTTTGGTVPEVVKYFFDQGICNFGILDSPADGVDKTSFEEMLESLKLLRQFSMSQTSRHRKMSHRFCRSICGHEFG